MACDRFVWFENDRQPSKDEVERCLRNYLGYAGIVDEDRDQGSIRYFVSLPGKPTSPFDGIKGSANVPLRDERWFEVIIEKGVRNNNSRLYVDVITREQDEFTMNIAQGFAELLARFWNGKLEQ